MVKCELKISPEKSAGASPASNEKKKKKYKGVRMRSWGSWVSEIRVPNQKTRIWLGSYSTAEAAARAYDAALLCLKGSSANLNFPVTSSHYIPDTQMSPKSIQKIAAAAANSGGAAVETAAPPPSASFSSSAAATPCISSSSSSVPSSPSDLACDDVSLVEPFDEYNLGFYNVNNVQQPLMNDSWHTFDQMFITGAPVINPPCPATIADDFYEGDIRLWSFTE